MAAVAGNFTVEKDPEVKAVLDRLEAEHADRKPEPAEKEHPLDSEPNKALFRKLNGWLQEEKSIQAPARLQMAIDEDFYDHQQWRAEDLATLAERGQAPLTFNLTFQSVNWLYGTAMRTKTDWKVKPREKDDELVAPAKSKLLKFVDDANHAVYERLAAFKESMKAGISWIDHGINGDPTQELVEIQHESWRNVWHDSKCRRLQLKGARYLFREKTLDEDIGVATWPTRAAMIRRCASAVDATDRIYDPQDPAAWDAGTDLNTGLGGSEDESATNQSGVGNALLNVDAMRRRLRVTECWYRVPVKKNFLAGSIFRGQEYDPANPTMVRAVRDQVCTVRVSVTMEVRYAIWCSEGLLSQGRSPFKHNEFPLVPVICYRRARDGTFYGVIRGMRDAQEDYNKRASKALHILSTRGVLFEVGAFEDEDEAREELSRPDFFIGYNAGRKVERIADTQIADGHLKLMEIDALHMEKSSGVTNELMAVQTQAVSGRAIEKRQQQGQLTTTEPFENYRLSQQMSGEIALSLCEQFHTAEFSFRITSEQQQGADDWETINQPQWDDQAQEWTFVNDVTKRQADFVISETDFRESVRIAQAEAAAELLGRMPPEVVIKLLDLWVELADLDNKSEWLKRIRKINGEPDPDEEKTPEGQQAKAEREAKQRAADELQQRAAKAEVDKLEGEAAKAAGQAKLSQAQMTDIITRAVKQAVEAAVAIVTTPGVTPAADVVLEAAGMPQFPNQIPTGVQPAAPVAPPGAPPMGA